MTKTSATSKSIPSAWLRSSSQKGLQHPSSGLDKNVAKTLLGNKDVSGPILDSVDVNDDDFVSCKELRAAYRDPSSVLILPHEVEHLDTIADVIRPWQVKASSQQRVSKLAIEPKTLADFGGVDVQRGRFKTTTVEHPGITLAEIDDDDLRSHLERLLHFHPAENGRITPAYLEALPTMKNPAVKRAISKLKFDLSHQSPPDIPSADASRTIVVPDDQVDRVPLNLDTPFSIALTSGVKSTSHHVDVWHHYEFGPIAEGVQVVVDGGRAQDSIFSSSQPIVRLDQLGAGHLSIYKDGKLERQVKVDVDGLNKLRPDAERISLHEHGYGFTVKTTSGETLSSLQSYDVTPGTYGGGRYSVSVYDNGVVMMWSGRDVLILRPGQTTHTRNRESYTDRNYYRAGIEEVHTTWTEVNIDWHDDTIEIETRKKKTVYNTRHHDTKYDDGPIRRETICLRPSSRTDLKVVSKKPGEIEADAI